MNRAFREFWRSPITLMILGSLFVALVLIIGAMLEIQRRGYERVNAAAMAQAIRQMRDDVERLRVENQASIRDRAQIRQDVEAVRKAVEE